MAQFPYLPSTETGTLTPRLPLTLAHYDQFIEVIGLVDSGSTVNVLPYQIGLALGAIWEDQTIQVPLAGTLASSDARVLILSAIIPRVSDVPVELGFAWTRSRTVPVILGQINFLLEFNACFYRAESVFDITRREVG